MFTGLVEQVGSVESLKGSRLAIRASFEDVKIGDSVAVNGVCLTVVSINKNLFEFDLSEETLSRSNLRFLKSGDLVNLERALRPSDRLGGHILQGHVDFTTPIIQLIQRGQHWSLSVRIKEGYEPFFVEKGSVGIDGISLTINSIEGNIISINIIPHTYKNTNLRIRKPGDLVNVEVDLIGKYVVNYLKKVKGGSLQSMLENLYNITP
ncbi:MAG: riboflavin synthase [Aquificaceae bacterium]|nr:riboflavin synthase [Aquificaceae bacterium]MDW8424101.1 riboflavin synthase [Aquificaceae bacterium]